MDPKSEEFIRSAIRMEIDAYNYYVDLLRREFKHDVKEFFSELAMQEIRHKRTLEIFMENEDYKEAFEMANEENILHDIMETDGKPREYEKDDWLLEAFKMAINMEEEAAKIYKRMIDSATDGQIRHLAATLMQMEASHKHLLEDRKVKIFGRL